MNLSVLASATEMDFKGWIIAGAIAVIVIALVLVPVIEKIRSTVAHATAQPLIEHHNSDPTAHAGSFASLGQAIALLRQSIEDLQRQINVSQDRHRDELEAIQRQIQIAFDLIGGK